MMSTRIYHPQNMEVGQVYRLSTEASHHLLNVLRFKVGDPFDIFDGCDHEYHAQIYAIEKKQIQFLITLRMQVCRESALKIHLAQGIAKGERWTFSLQKAVELGVHSITPLWTQHVAYKWEKKLDEKKMAQWQGIVVSACEQSGRTRLPMLHPIQTLDDFLNQDQSVNKIILQPESGHHWRQIEWSAEQSVSVLIGPEGGFSSKEYEKALAANYQGMTLGPRILRTETAVVSALTILQASYGDL